MLACAGGSLDNLSVHWSPEVSTTVVMASAGYPATSTPPAPITGLAEARSRGCLVFHAGTEQIDGVVHATGGRVWLGVTALGKTLTEAAERAYAGVEAISFEGSQYRGDIGCQPEPEPAAPVSTTRVQSTG